MVTINIILKCNYISASTLKNGFVRKLKCNYIFNIYVLLLPFLLVILNIRIQQDVFIQNYVFTLFSETISCLWIP